jgi:hypothetical protein
MGFRDKFKKHSKDLQRTHEEQHNRPDRKSFSSLFIPEVLAKHNVQIWRPDTGDHFIDVLPFLAGPNHPHVKEDKPAYLLDLDVHRNVGPMNLQYVCLSEIWGEPCPICEDIKAVRRSIKEWNEIRAYRRCFYFVWVKDTEKEKAKGIQVWEVPYHFFQKKIEAISKIPVTGGIIPWTDLDHGKSVAFQIQKSGTYKRPDGSSGNSVEYLGFQFVDRQEMIPDKICDMVFPLDDALKMKASYEEIYNEYHRGSGKSEPDGTREQATERKPRTPIQTQTDEKDPEDQINEAWDKTTCPHNAVFGKDNDKYPACNNCEVWDDCMAALSNMKQDEQTEPENAEPEPEKVEEPPKRTQRGKSSEKSKDSEEEKPALATRRTRRPRRN